MRTEEVKHMRGKTKAAIAAAIIVIGGAGAGVAVASGNDDATESHDKAEKKDKPITGSNLERASKAALDHVGEGRVTETEKGDEESYYEVEVTRDNGSQVDVQLDRDFNFVSQEEDQENG
jgi:uncharacterized membrane protein YkoI